MATNFNVNPYYDDFSEDKKFHRVLFRPGFAVQARELTQLQSILQNQIKRFGDHVFKDGTQVIPGEITYINTYNYAKLTTFSTSSVTDLIGTTFTGDTSGVVAEVTNAVAATDTDAATIYFNYTKGGTNTTESRFRSGETLTGDGGETATVGTDNVTLPIDSPAVGVGSAVRIEEGIYYIDGFFVKNNAQVLILEKYFNNATVRVGFEVTESFITPADDASLNDNAQGTSNENAPGAHRYKIDVTLVAKDYDATDDDNFVELIQILNGNLVTKIKNTEYSIIGDTLARRTFDESGNYTVREFDLDIREHHYISGDDKYGRGIYRPDTTDVGTAENPRYEVIYNADESKARLAVGMGSGKAYVEGYELETITTKYVTIEKARDFNTVNNTTVGLNIGNYVDVTNVYGSPDVDTITGETEAYKQVELYKEATSSRGTANSGAGTDIHTIGVAYPKFFEYKSGTVGASSSNTSSQYKLGLFNITAFTHLRTTLAHSLTTGETITGGTSGATAVVETSSATVSAAISNMVGTSTTLTVTTSSAHNLSTGQRVTFDSVGGMTEVNGNTYEITVTSSTEFTISVDASGFSAYTSGGTAQNGIVVVSNVKGTFTAGETITGATSTNTAVIDSDTDYFKSIITYDFKNTKQIYQPGTPTFTADTVLTADSTDAFDDSQTILTGSISVANSSAAVIGKNTRFTTELVAGDVIAFTDDTGEALTGTVLAIASNTSLTLDAAVGAADVTTSSPFERRRTKLQDSENNTLIFEMPEENIKTLKTATNSGVTDTTFTVRRQFVTTLSGDGIGIFNANANETFASLTSGDFTLMHITAGASAGSIGDITSLSGNNHEGDPIFVRNAGNDQLTIDLGANYSGSQVKLTTTIVRQVAGEKSKTLVSGATVDITTQATATASSISLGKADIYQLNAIYMSADFSTDATTSDTDISDRFDLDNGQRDNFYDLGRIKIRPGALAPTGRLLIDFDYFRHGAGDYFSVDSYSIDYEDIPSFVSSVSERELQLRDCIDFRPRVADGSDVVGYNDKDATGSKNFINTGAVSVDIPKPGSNFRADFEFYLSRIDGIVLTTAGDFKQIRGASAIDPQKPAIIDGAMLLYYLKLPAYTFNTGDIEVIPIDNRRYTMRDIGKLESRIENLEYYTSLSLLEQETLNLQIKDADGFDRFKNGFLVDTFQGHNVGDTGNSDYKIAMDLDNGLVRPMCFTDQIQMAESATTDTARTSAGYQLTGTLITLPYTETELVSNLKATTTASVNPFNVFTYVGNMTLYPDMDEWKDIKTRPDLTVNNKELYNSIRDTLDATDALGMHWNEWQNNWTGKFKEKAVTEKKSSKKSKNKDIETTTNITTTTTTTTKGKTGTATRTGVKRELTAKVKKQSFGERIVDMSYAPFIRSREIRFVVTGLKPNTQHFPFFEEVDVSAYCKPVNTATIQGAPIYGPIRPATPTQISSVLGRPIYAYARCGTGTFSNGNFGDPLISNENGSINGIFQIPDPRHLPRPLTGLARSRRLRITRVPRWRTGERIFKLVDTNLNHQTNKNNLSTASAKYRAQGLVLTEQETILSTKVPEIITTKTLSDSKKIKKVTDTNTIVSVDVKTSSNLIDRGGGNHNTGSGGSNSSGSGNNDKDKDRDRDGVPDNQDYKPNDPKIQRKGQDNNKDDGIPAAGTGANGPPGRDYDSGSDTNDNAGGGGGGGGGGGKVLCNYIYELGLLDKELWKLDEQYGEWVSLNDPELMIGYHAWALPLIEEMKSNTKLGKVAFFFTKLLVPHWAKYLAGEKTILGSLLHNIGQPICRIIGKIKKNKINRSEGII